MAKKERNFRPLTAELYQFEKEGDKLEGTVTGKVFIEFQNGPVGKYTVVDDDGEYVSFLGSTILDQCMEQVQIGNYVRIVFQGKQKTLRGQEVRVYNVEVAVD